ncbi:MAG: hypothetical protein SangKO_022070 [Sandaracinaceae bacterium]
MAKKSLLLVDADPRSLRVLEVSLRKAGYSVATCRDAQSALETVDLSEPDLILSDTRLPGMNGFELVEELRKQDGNDAIPFMFLSSDSSVESKVRGLELGVEDYLTKPIYIKEIITRINLTLQRQEREGLAKRTSISKTRFTGSLGDMGLVDLLQTIDISRKSGVLELTNEGQRGSISFRDGQLVDAEMGRLAAENAIYRLLLWNEGEFEIDFRPVRVEPRITASTQAILMEGMRRIDEWGRLLEQIPTLDNVFEVSEEELVERLAEIPDEINQILRFIDGRRSLLQVVDLAGGDDLETLTAITKLYFEGIVYPTGRTVSPDEQIDDNLLVGEEPLTEDGDLDEADVPDLVPRAPTEPPPATLDVEAATDRAKADGGAVEAAGGVSEDASEDVPDLGLIGADPGTGPAGMEDAEPKDLASGPSDEATEAQVHGETSLEVGGVDDDEPLDEEAPPEEAEDEDGMARKGRRRRKRREKAAQEAQAQEQGQQEAKADEAESANNVIQFPAQSKRGVATSQVAVNDGVVAGSDEDEDEADRDEAIARQDDTQTVKRDEPAAKEEAAEEAAPSEAEAATTVPDLTAEAERALAEDDDATEAAAEEPAEEAEAKAEPAEQPAEKEEEAKAEPSEPAAKEEAKAEPAAKEEAKAEPSGRKRKKKRKSKKAREREARKSEAPAAKSASEKPAAKPESEKPAAKSKPEKESEKESEKPAAKSESKKPESDSDAPRRKKKQTTTSAEIRAVTATGEHAAVAEDFFRSEQKEHQVEHETWDDLQKSELPISPGMKKAKYATFAILAAGFVLIGGYVVYQNVIMPQPVQLSGGAPPELPDTFGDEAETTPDEPEQAPEVEEAVAAPVEEAEGEAVDGEAVEGEAVAEGEEAALEGEAEAAVEGEEAAEGEAVAAVEEPAAEEPAAEEPAAEEPAASPADARRIARQALSALNRRRNEEAAQLAQQALAADSTIALGWLVLGAARQEMRDAAGAREAYQNCVDQGQGREVGDCRAMLR